MLTDAASVFVLPRGYGEQAWWWDRWHEVVDYLAAPERVPEVWKEWPYRDETDPRWSAPCDFAFYPNPDGMLADLFFESQRTEGVRFDDVYAFARAPWNAEQAGLELALFNAQGESGFTWSPAAENMRVGDLTIPDLAPHDGFDAQRLNADWWRAEVRRSAESVLGESRLRQVTHPSLRAGIPTVDQLGLFRVRVDPRTGPDGALAIYADRFVPFPRGLTWEELTTMANAAGSDTSVLTQGVAVRCGSANAFLFELAKHYWTVTPDDRDSEDVRHLLSSAGERDKRRFDRALGGFVDGRPLMRPRGLGKVWAGNEPEVVSRRKDFGPDAFSALVFRHDGAASASRADPAVPPGWSVAPPVARDELADVLAPQPPGSAARVTIVFDQDWQVTSGMGHDEFGRAAAVHAGLEEVAVGPGVGQLQAYRHSDDDLVYVVPAEDLDVVVESLLRAVAAKWPSPAPPARRAAPAEEPRDVLRVLVLATEWHSRKGGISSFNRGLCKALARAGAQVECLVGPDEDASIDDSNPVRLTRVGTVDGRTEEGAVIQALSTHRAMLGDPDIVIGHGHITGGAARELAVAHYPHALRVHIVHTRPVPLAAAKATEDSTTVLSRGEAKLERERKNARTAQLVCGVGPKLFAEAEELVRAAVPAPLVINLMPGLDAEIPQVESWPPRRSNVYTVGRVTDEAKGTEVLIKAIKALQTDGRRVALWIRGVPPAEADEAQALLGRRIHDVFIRPYSADTKQLHEDLWNTTVMCMPSREEGFGLVALEAIAAGIPVLVDRYSGLAEVLEEIDRGDPAIVDAPPSEAQAARVWRDKIVAVLDDPLTHRARALRRRADLAARCDWDASAAQLLDAIKRVRVRVV